MDGVYTTAGVLITDHIRQAIPGYETSKAKNRLLSGEWHLQTIGSGAKNLRLEVWADLDGVNTLNGFESTGTPIRVKARGVTYTGYIADEGISWGEDAPGYYRAGLEIMVTEEV